MNRTFHVKPAIAIEGYQRFQGVAVDDGMVLHIRAEWDREVSELATVQLETIAGMTSVDTLCGDTMKRMGNYRVREHYNLHEAIRFFEQHAF